MELKEAKRIMEEWSSSYHREVGENDDSLVIDTVLQALENSIPTKKIEDKIKELEPELELQHLEREARLQIRLLQKILED